MPITLSIAISNEEKTYYERYKSALDGIDLVLGRGGEKKENINSMEEHL